MSFFFQESIFLYREIFPKTNTIKFSSVPIVPFEGGTERADYQEKVMLDRKLRNSCESCHANLMDTFYPAI